MRAALEHMEALGITDCDIYDGDGANQIYVYLKGAAL